jgi:hypothetical protein
MSNDTNGLSIDEFKVNLYHNQSNGGAVITISGTMKRRGQPDLKNLILKANGKFWNLLSRDTKSNINKYMPLRLAQYNKKVEIVGTDDTRSRFTIELHIGTGENGQSSISHNTIIEELDKLIGSGDDVIELVFCEQQGGNVFKINTKPSLIKASIGYYDNALLNIPAGQGARIIYEELPGAERWFLYPALFLILCWVLAINHDFVTSRVPVVFTTAQDKVAYYSRLPPYPKTLSKAWDISRIEYSILELEKQNKTEGIKPLLDEIGMLLDAKDVTLEEIHRIRHRIEQVESEKSFAQRVYGMFTFVNFMWMLAILGITVTIVPCIFLLLGPLQGAFMLLGTIIWEGIIVPFHYLGIWELCAYIITSMFLIEGFRFNIESGFYISLTGMALAVPAYSYSFALHSTYSFEDIKFISTFWFSTCLLPLAVYYESSLLIWIIVMGYYSCIGFSFICTGLCYYIGFENKDAMARVCINSLILQILFIGSKILGITIPAVKLVQTPIITFSCILLSLALLIVSNVYYGDIELRSGKKLTYGDKQLLMILNLIICIAVGSVYGIGGLANTGYVFFVLYIIEKYVETHIVCQWNLWGLFFISSVGLYYGALYLHRNPNLIISLFVYD